MSVLKFVEGDLFVRVKDVVGPVLIPHVCNDKGVFGAGFALAVSRYFPHVREAYLGWFAHGVDQHDKRVFGLGECQYVPVGFEGSEVEVVNMVAQGLGGSRPLRYAMLAKCMEELGHDAVTGLGGKPVIFCPFFGAGLAGGDWNFIEELIKDCWLDRGLLVTVCYLPGQVPQGFVVPVGG